MKKILVPVDGSEQALRALEAGLKAVEDDPNASLWVISVQPPVLSGNVSRFISSDTIHDFYTEEGTKALSNALPLLAAQSLGANTAVLVGPVAQTIVDYAKDNGFTQIIMGSRGLGSIGSLLLGSVATKVLSLTDLPVTLVK